MRRGRIGVLGAGLALAGAVLLPAHDDEDKSAEFGPPLPGSGHVGEPLLPDADGRILGFPAENVALLGWLTPEDLTGVAQLANDVWAYVSPSGREYAIVGLEQGTAFVEVTDPLEPQVVSVVRGRPSAWRDMAVHEQVAYSVSEGGGGVQVIDLRRIDRGRVRLRRRLTTDGLATAHNISVDPDSWFAYLSGSNLEGGGLVAVDLAKPLRPRLVPGGWPFVYVHDALPVTYANGPNAGREVVFAFAGPDGVQILDVTDKRAMFQISEVRYPNLAYCHSGWLNRRRGILFVNDELDEPQRLVATTTTHILKVRDLERPVAVRPYTNGSTAVDHNSMVRGNYLFQANYRSGLRVFRIKRPRHPREVAWFDTYPADDRPRFSGAWGVHAALPSGTVLVTDIQRGLFLLHFDG